MFCEIIFAVLIFGIIHLPSPHFWTLEPDYINVLGGLMRFVSAGFLAVLCSGLANVYTMLKWKIALAGKNFILRSVDSSVLGGLILIVITLTVGYSGTVLIKTLFTMFFSIYILELIYALWYCHGLQNLSRLI